jgi:hypothetical protein
LANPSTSQLRRLSREFLIFKYWSLNQLHHCVAEQIRVVTVVEPESHFIEVGFKTPLWVIGVVAWGGPSHQYAMVYALAIIPSGAKESTEKVDASPEQ